MSVDWATRGSQSTTRPAGIRPVLPSEPRGEGSSSDIRLCVERLASPVAVFENQDAGRWPKAIQPHGQELQDAFSSDTRSETAGLIALLPPIVPEALGHHRFTTIHGCRFAYVVGEMARGIATTDMVIAAARSGFLGFFGSAGLRPAVIAQAIDTISTALAPGTPWGMNLIHSPDHPERETEIADLFLQNNVRRISASAFMQLSPQVVRLAAAGLSRVDNGAPARAIHIFAKVSRPEVARAFMTPPPEAMLRELAAAGLISEAQAEMQSRLPVAEDITVEADSGGHTDNRSLRVVFPVIDGLRQQLVERHAYQRPIRLGAAGGLGTPSAIASAFHLGADYVVTGSVNQAAVESGLSLSGRRMLAACGIADVAMAPAADMFERGVKVQVLRKGTMFHVRGHRLHDLYRRHAGLHEIAGADRTWLEQQVLHSDCDAAWHETRTYHATRNPNLVARADADAKLQMALVFRRYLFMGAQWAREGHDERQIDYQIWCGPAMGAFNEWVRGSYLEPLEHRTVGQIGHNLLEGACAFLRGQHMRSAGVDVPDRVLRFTPRRLQFRQQDGV